MKFRKLTVQFDAPDISSAEELICDIFFSFKLKGVVCDIPLEEPDEGFGTDTLPVPEICSVTGYLPLLDSTDLIVEKISRDVSALAGLDITTRIESEIVDEKEWADAWKEYFEVTRITDRIVIKPEWKSYSPGADDICIHLDPGMAFGTGTHPTTAMCIRLIETYLDPGADFLDVGTGSGILMITAQKLGAGHLTGIDTDETAIQVARENLEKNAIGPDSYSLYCTTLDKMPAQSPSRNSFKIIAANIIAQVIVEILPQIAAVMDDDSTAILSGIIKERMGDVSDALNSAGLMVVKEEHTDEWVALAVKKDLGMISRKQTAHFTRHGGPS